jgi:hypothetical protein
MANLGREFNRDQLPQGTSSYDPIPAGWYPARIVEADPTDTKSGSGSYLKMQWEIMGQNHANRRVFGNLTLRNENEKAEQIGMEQMRALMDALGIPVLKQSEQLIGKSCEIKVSIRAAQGQYEASNDVKGFRAAGGNKLPAPGPSAMSSSGAAPAAASKKPWEK